MTSHDAALVASILGGETSRFDEIVRRFGDAVRRTIARDVREPDTREELSQKAFVLAFRRLDQLREPGRLEAWLKRIARNCVADHYRAAGRREATGLAADARPGPSRDGLWVWEEVDALPPAFADVLRLRYREGRSYRGIAVRLGVPVSTVRGRIYQARRALRSRLEEDGDHGHRTPM